MRGAPGRNSNRPVAEALLLEPDSLWLIAIDSNG